MCLYQYYQNWINAMRANGGGNAVRWLMVQAPMPLRLERLLTMDSICLRSGL